MHTVYCVVNPFLPLTYFISKKDAAKICQNFMSRDPSELHFSVVALAAASQ